MNVYSHQIGDSSQPAGRSFFVNGGTPVRVESLVTGQDAKGAVKSTT